MNEWLIIPILFLSWMALRLIRSEAIFIPLPKSTIRKMLKLAKVRKKDIVYDLGCGDGRILVIAAKEFGCNAVGIERDKLVAMLCKFNIKRSGLQNKIKLIENDYFKVNLRKATVVTTYLSQKQNDLLLPKLKRELRKGTRIVSASHVFKGLKEIKRIRTGHFYTYLYKI